jgi:diphosphomevalonate decarboxylase
MENNIQSGKVVWKAPSNIAIVKYWGKHGIQIPRNPSISLTLKNAFTETSIQYEKKQNKGISLEFLFEGKQEVSFENKIKKYFSSIIDDFAFLNEYHLKIESKNSFPHSSGIASSASSMAALSLCLNDIKSILEGDEYDFLKEASHIARLGSGSASRSVYPYAAIWGNHDNIPYSRDEYAIEFSSLHPVFKSYHNDILIVSSHKKSVSSTAGHQLMEDNIYAKARYKQASDNCERLFSIMQKGDTDGFIEIAEDEALTLHALMMSSHPSYILLEPNSIAVVKKIRAFREETKVPICFTIDAGPNIHVLYPHVYKAKCKAFINEELKPLCENGIIIEDEVGEGPEKLK